MTIAQLSHNQSGLSDGISDNVLGSSIQNMESEFPEIPSLIYDGPFSEHLLTMEPLYTKDLPEVSEEEAKSAAAEFLGVSPEKLTVTGRREGTVPVFMMETSRDSGTLYVEVTVNGGLILQLTDSRAVVRGTVSQEDAVQTAKNLLDSMGYTCLLYTSYIAEMDRLKSRYSGQLRLWCGVEEDLFAPSADRGRYDYIIGDVHYAKDPVSGEYIAIDGSREDFARALNLIYNGNVTRLIARYYDCLLYTSGSYPRGRTL